MNRERDKHEMMADMLEHLIEADIESMPEAIREQTRQPFRALKAVRGLRSRLSVMTDPGKTPEEFFERTEEAREIADYLELVLAGMDSFIAAHPQLRRRFTERDGAGRRGEENE